MSKSTDPSDLKIALVDDNLQMRAIVSVMLRGFGVRNIVHFSDGRAFLEQLSPDQFDLIICDVVMDGMDGLAVVEKVRRHANLEVASLPIIMLTGIREAGTVIKARNLGATEYLVKPVAPHVLWQRVTTLLRNPRPFVEDEGYRGPERRPPLQDTYLSRVMIKNDQAMAAKAAVKRTSVTPAQAMNSIKLGLDELALSYPGQLAKDTGELTAAQNAVFQGKFDAVLVRGLFKKAHDIKGQAGTFGYELVTEITQSLCVLLKGILEHPDAIAERGLALESVIRMHVDAVRICSDRDIRGVGGSDGLDLMRTLKSAARKFHTALGKPA